MAKGPTVRELKRQAKAARIRGYSRMRKAELLAALGSLVSFPKKTLADFRTEVIGGVTLILGDCRDVMPLLDPVDHVISDPPYEAHMHDAKRGEKIYGARQRIRIDGHANPPPVDFASIDGMREFVSREMVRLSKGWLLVFCTPEGVAPWRDAIEATGAKYKRACVWIKPDSAPQFNGQGPAMGAEMFCAAWCGRGHSSWNGGGRRNVFTHPCQPTDRTGEHPTEKPLSLMGELVSLFTQPDQVVLDPFAGSGSTLVASAKLGRRAIGIEVDPEYFDLSCRRVRVAYAQPDFFVPATSSKPKQVNMLEAL